MSSVVDCSVGMSGFQWKNKVALTNWKQRNEYLIESKFNLLPVSNETASIKKRIRFCEPRGWLTGKWMVDIFIATPKEILRTTM